VRFDGSISIWRMELRRALVRPLTWAILALFPGVLSFLTLSPGPNFAGGQADLSPFFALHPFAYCIIAPALAALIWTEDVRTGVYETQLSLGGGLTALVFGKFVAALCVVILALALTLPLWFGVSALGPMDQRVTFVSYLLSAFMAAGYLSLSFAVCSFFRNAWIAFAVTMAIAFGLTWMGTRGFSEVLANISPMLSDALAGASPARHFEPIVFGVYTPQSLIYFVALTIAGLTITAFAADAKREG
jgi:ABC-2 type transport system permease protein